MARILMTGMCSVHDRTSFLSESGQLRFGRWPAAISTYAQVMEQFRIAGNTGNYFISEAAYRSVSEHSVDYVPFWHLFDKIRDREFVDALNCEYDFCLFVTANILNEFFSLADEVEVLSAITLPKIFMSVGVQKIADLRLGRQAGRGRFLNILSQPNSYIFTRGPHAAKYLRSEGVKNLFEASCPSAFSYSRNIIKGIQKLRTVELFEVKNIWLNGYLGDPETPSVTDIMTFGAVSPDMTYVLQDEPNIFRFLDDMKDRPAIYDEASGKLDRGNLRGFAEIDLTYSAFFSPEQWRVAASTVDLIAGRRFHGNLVGLQAGQPAFFIAHDDRVEEMLAGVGLPYVEADAWDGAEDKIRYFEHFTKRINYAKFEEKYCKTENDFRAALKSILG